MIIYLNIKSNSGRTEAKWNKIKEIIYSIYPEVWIIKADSSADDKIRRAIASGETNYLSAGGDGTLNSLLNILMDNSSIDECNKFKIGALGLGSSNDFHKPFNKRIAGVPVRIDFDNYETNDVGVIEYIDENSIARRKYWIINASIGVLADANMHFNHKGVIWNYFKRYLTGSAIIYSALITIAGYRNKICRLKSKELMSKTIYLSNLGIAKNPNFAGDFSYPGTYNPSNGLFSLYLMENMSVTKTLLTLIKLWKNKSDRSMNIYKGESDSIEIESNTPLNVEFDGEVISTTKLQFSLISKAIGVCK